jgi:hypothetical protein
MRRPARACPITQSESSYPQGNQLLDVVRTTRVGDRREYRRGIAFPHSEATRAGWVPAFLAASTCHHYHLAPAIRIRTNPMFPFLHHVSKFLLVCPISMSLPGKVCAFQTYPRRTKLARPPATRTAGRLCLRLWPCREKFRSCFP